MIEELHDFLPFFITDRIQDVLERCATLPSLGLDPSRDPSPGTIDVALLDKPGGGVAYEFQRTALELFETQEATGPAKNALDRAWWNYERAVLHRFAGSFAMAQLEKAEAAHQKAVAMHQDDANKYDVARETHAAATARLVQELTRALLIVQKRDEGRLGKDYQALLNEIIFLRQSYAIESRIRNYLDGIISKTDLGGSNARQPNSEIPAVFDASLATSYLSDSYIDMPEMDLKIGETDGKGGKEDGKEEEGRKEEGKEEGKEEEAGDEIAGKDDVAQEEVGSGDGGDTIKADVQPPAPGVEGQ